MSTSDGSTSSLTTAEIGSYAELRDFLRRLPAPVAGRKRMFRGQTKSHEEAGRPSLLPALVRGETHTYDPAWLVSIQMYSLTVDEHGASTPYDNVYLWGPALLQHYGPGSCYLDVTSDLDVALWFAIYQRHEKWLALQPAGKMARSHCVCWHTLIELSDQAVAPVLYVFDAAPWSGTGSPAHGELVELTTMDVAGKLPREARRLHCQVASLLFSDLGHAQGPDLGPEVVAMARLSRSFDLTTVPAYGRPVAEVFPPPSADSFYHSLMQVPAQLHLDPNRFEDPLAIPCYIERPPSLPFESAGSARDSPILLTAEQAASIAGFEEFVDLGRALNPDLMFGFAVTAKDPSFGEPIIPTTSDGKQYRLADATPFLMEGPLWSYLPSCHTEEERGEWIQSALPIGIAPLLADRPTDNVYIEMSTVDVQYPRRDNAVSGYAVRGIWTVRSGHRYWCVVYCTDETGPFSMASEFRFWPSTGQFFRVPPEGERARTEADVDAPMPRFEVIQKALFTSLLLLRDLSPGLKPPSTFAQSLPGKDGSLLRMIGYVLEPCLGTIHKPASAPFLVPRALDGTTYARASGSDSVDGDAWRKSDEGFAALMNAFRQVKESEYVTEAGAELARLCLQRDDLEAGLEVARFALATAKTSPPTSLSQVIAAELERLRQEILRRLAGRPA